MSFQSNLFHGVNFAGCLEIGMSFRVESLLILDSCPVNQKIQAAGWLDEWLSWLQAQLLFGGVGPVVTIGAGIVLVDD